MQTPKFKDHLQVQVIGGDKVLLLSDFGQRVLTSEPCAKIAPWIDGRRSVEEIARAVQESVSREQVLYIVEWLREKRYVSEAGNGCPVGTSAYWNALGAETAEVLGRLEARRVRSLVFGKAPVAEWERSLGRAGVRLAGGTDVPALTVAITDDYLQTGLRELGDECLHREVPWMLVKPNGLEIWIGPIFVPGTTGCYRCLEQRLELNRDVDQFVQAATGRTAPYASPIAFPPSVDLGLSLAAAEVAKYVALGANEVLTGKVLTFHTGLLQTTHHTLVKRPQCPACGAPADRDPEREPSPIELVSGQKQTYADGGHRTASPERVMARFQHHVSSVTGVVRQLDRITPPEDRLQHVYISGQNMARRQESYASLRKNLRSSSCGKGLTDAQARVSAMGEAMERYSGVFRGDEPRIRGSLKSLGDRAIDPRSSMLYSERQYRNRDGSNRGHGLYHLNPVPLPFDEARDMEWSPLWSLSRRTFRYLPTSYCYYSYPIVDDTFFCLPDSNGSAAGATVEEAILQGFLELVERDAVCLWWYNRLSRPGVDLESFGSPYLLELRRYHESRHRRLWALDLTSDLGIPAFVALSVRTDRATFQDIVFAPAAHLDPHVALLRAVAELNQMMPAIDDGLPPGEYAYQDEEAVRWWRTATIQNQGYLNPCAAVPPTRLDRFERTWGDDLREDIDYCRRLVESQGMEMLVLDQTRPDVGMPVVKVVVPGLRHFWARFAPGRLYETPVRLGWLDRPYAEHELNPIPIFI